MRFRSVNTELKIVCNRPLEVCLWLYRSRCVHGFRGMYVVREFVYVCR